MRLGLMLSESPQSTPTPASRPARGRILDESTRIPIGDVESLLIVEDSAEDARLIQVVVRRATASTEVTVATTLDEALSLLPGDYTIVLLDLNLPDGAGVDVVERVAAASPQTPIVVMTETVDDRLAVRCLERGADDVVAKVDITERGLMRAIESVAARQRACLLRQRLEHAERLVRAGQLAATMAHEVNNPASYVRMNTEQLVADVRQMAQMLEHQGSAPTVAALQAWLRDASAMLDDNIDGIDRIARLATDMRHFCQPQKSPRDTVDVTALCRSSLNVVMHHLRHRANLVVELRDVPPVVADAQRLGQVLTNLLMNAGQAIEDGRPRDNEIRLHVRAEPDAVVIEVCDSGCGIPAHARAEIFKPFYTTKRGGEGTGLGLWISLDIVQQMGGTLTVAERSGGGSRFSVRLPVANKG